MAVGQTPRWLAAAVRVMFLAWRRGRKSSMPGTATCVTRWRKISRAMARLSLRWVSLLLDPASLWRADAGPQPVDHRFRLHGSGGRISVSEGVGTRPITGEAGA